MKELRTLPDGSITYELHRKRVKNMNLRVTASGVVQVSASPRVPLGMIEEFICRHRAFIENALQNRKDRSGHPMVPAVDTEIMVIGTREIICLCINSSRGYIASTLPK